MSIHDYDHHLRFGLAYAVIHESVAEETPKPTPEQVRQMTERFLAAFPEFPRPLESRAVTLSE